MFAGPAITMHQRTAALPVPEEIPEQGSATFVRIDSAEIEQERFGRAWSGIVPRHHRIEAGADDAERRTRPVRTSGNQLGFLGCQKDVAARQREKRPQNGKSDERILFGRRNQHRALGHQGQTEKRRIVP